MREGRMPRWPQVCFRLGCFAAWACLSGCGNADREGAQGPAKPPVAQTQGAASSAGQAQGQPGALPQAPRTPRPALDAAALGKRLAEEAEQQQAEVNALSADALVLRRTHAHDALRRFELVGYILNRAKKEKWSRDLTRDLAGPPDEVEAGTDLYKMNYYYPFEIQTKNGTIRPSFHTFTWSASFDGQGRCVEIGRDVKEQQF